MKKRILNISLILALASTGSVFAQQGFGTDKPNKSAAVDIVSSNKGLLIPRMDLTWNTADAEIVAPVTTPAKGLLVYNKTGIAAVPEGFYYYDGAKWTPIGVSVLQDSATTTVSGSGTAGDPYKVNVAAATTTTLGVVQVGENINVTDGVISVRFPAGTVDTNTKNKTLAVSNTELVLTDSENGTVEVPLIDLDKQQLSLVDNMLELDRSTPDVDLSKYLDNTDNQQLLYDTTTNVLTLERGGDGIDLSALAVDTNTDEQKLSYEASTKILTLERGGDGIDLSALALDTNSKTVVEGAASNVVVTQATVAATDTTTYTVAVKNAMPKFFYMPSVLISTSAATGSVNLYTTYTGQFSAPLVKSGSAETGGIPTLSAKELDFYVTYYDTTVISNVNITSDGVMSYTVIGAPTNLSFINVVFKVRDTPKQP